MIRKPRRRRLLWCVESLEARTLLSQGGVPIGPSPSDNIASQVIVGFKGAGPDASTQALLNSWDAQVSLTWSTGTLFVLAPSVNTSQAISQLEQQSDVEYAEPNAVGQAASNSTLDDEQTLQAYLNPPTPSNPTGTDAVDAWSNWVATGNAPTTVAVVDSGIDYSNPNLYLNMWLNPNAIPPSIASQIQDTDGNGELDFYDLNSLNAQGQVVDNASGQPVNAALTQQLDGNPYVDASDLLNDPNWNSTVDDNDGYTGDLIGWNFTGNNNNPADSTKINTGNSGSHGTAVAGIIAGSGNSVLGAQGIASGTTTAGVPSPVRIMDLQAGNNGSFTNANLAAAISYASENGAKVLVASIQGLSFSNAVLEAISAASPNMVIVFAAGNSGKNLDAVNTSLSALTIPVTNLASPAFNQLFPALYGSLTPSELSTLSATLNSPGLTTSNVVVVANATNVRTTIPTSVVLDSQSNYGPKTVAIAAPGDNVLTTVQAGDSLIIGQPDYGFRSGTSFAAPMVAAALALRANQDPTDTAATLINQVVSQATTISSLANKVGSGGAVLNVANATALGGGAGNPQTLYAFSSAAGQITLNLTGDPNATSGVSAFPVGSPIYRSSNLNTNLVQIGTTGAGGFFVDSFLDPSQIYTYAVIVNQDFSTTSDPLPSPSLADTTKYLATDSFDTATPPNGVQWISLGGSWLRADGIEAQRDSTGPATGSRKLILNTTNTLPTDLDEEAKVRVDSFTDPTGSSVLVGLGLATNTTTGQGYELAFASTSTGQHVVEFVNDATGQVGNAYPFNWTTGTWYWFRLQAFSDHLDGQVWADGTSEPTTFSFTQPWANQGGAPELIGGAIAAGSSGYALASFDSFSVRDISDSQPLTSATITPGGNGGSTGVTITPSATALSPTTATSLPNTGQWYHGPVTVDLQAFDRGYQSGALTIQYSLDGGPEQTYYGPFTIFADGIHTVSYSSFDPAHNIEETRALIIKIEQSGPTIVTGAVSVQQSSALAEYAGGVLTVKAAGVATDNLSGVNFQGAKATVTTTSGQPVATLGVVVTSNVLGQYTFTIQFRIPPAQQGGGQTYLINLVIPNGAGVFSTRTLVVQPTQTSGTGPTSVVYKASWLSTSLVVVKKD